MNSDPKNPLIKDFKIELFPPNDINSEMIEKIVALINEAFDRHRWLFPMNRTSVQEFSDDLTQSESILILKETNGEILGTSLIHIEEDAICFGNAAIKTSCQGNGFGTNMVKAIENFAKTRSLNKLRIKTVEEIGNVRYYQRIGFFVVSNEQHPEGTWGALRPFCLATMEKVVC